MLVRLGLVHHDLGRLYLCTTNTIPLPPHLQSKNVLHLKGDTIPHAVVIPLHRWHRENQNGGYMEILHIGNNTFSDVCHPPGSITHIIMILTSLRIFITPSASWRHRCLRCGLEMSIRDNGKTTWTNHPPIWKAVTTPIYLCDGNTHTVIVCVGQCSHCFHCLLVQQSWHKHFVSLSHSLYSGFDIHHGSQTSLFWASWWGVWEWCRTM